jgi:hypothetical protein
VANSEAGKTNLDAEAIDGCQKVPDKQQEYSLASFHTNKVGDDGSRRASQPVNQVRRSKSATSRTVVIVDPQIALFRNPIVA